MPRAFTCPAGMLAAALAAAACAPVRPQQQLALTPAELREVLSRRIPREEVVIPFELTPEQEARARELVAGVTEPAEQVRILLDAFLDPRAFGLRYQAGVPGTAADAFRNRGGDCLALASAFIGLARAVGLDASYMDASFRVQSTEYLDDQTTVKVGHITAFVRLPGEKVGLDFALMGRIDGYQPMDDVEAVAHYHNNLGYILLARAEGGGPADLAPAAHQFELATRVEPGFARAWNNLGVVRARQGRRAEAVAAYRRAISADGALASPRLNLGALLLDAGELRRAADLLETAARLDPKAPHVLYELGLARLRLGDRDGAVQALSRAVALRGGWPAAQAVLDRIAAGGGPDAG